MGQRHPLIDGGIVGSEFAASLFLVVFAIDKTRCKACAETVVGRENFVVSLDGSDDEIDRLILRKGIFVVVPPLSQARAGCTVDSLARFVDRGHLAVTVDIDGGKRLADLQREIDRAEARA